MGLQAPSIDWYRYNNYYLYRHRHILDIRWYCLLIWLTTILKYQPVQPTIWQYCGQPYWSSLMPILAFFCVRNASLGFPPCENWKFFPLFIINTKLVLFPRHWKCYKDLSLRKVHKGMCIFLFFWIYFKHLFFYQYMKD